MKRILAVLSIVVLLVGVLPMQASAARGSTVLEKYDDSQFTVTKFTHAYYEPYTDSDYYYSIEKDARVKAVAKVKNDLNDIWYQLTYRKSTVYVHSSYLSEEWHSVKSIKTTFAMKLDDYSHSEPFEASARVKAYSKGTRVTMVAEIKNKYGNTWYKTTDGTYIYSDDLVFQSKWKTEEKMTAVFAFNYQDKSHKQPYEASAAVKTYNKDAEVDVVESVRNDYNNLWYKLKDGSFVYKDDITEQWRQTSTFDIYYKFNKADESRKKPFESSALTKSYSKGSVVRAVAAVKNKYGNTWYKLSDGSFIYSGDVDEYYKVVKSLDQYFWVTSLTAVSHKYPDDSSDQAKAYLKGEYVHIVQEVKNYRGITGGNTWYKTDKGTFLYSGDIEFRYEYITCQTGVYEAINYNNTRIEFCSTPFTDSNSATLQVGTLVTVFAAVKNSAGNTWYEIRENSGTRRWVWSKCFRYVGNTAGMITSLDFDTAAMSVIALGGYTYTGKAVKPGVVVKAGSIKLTKGTDYTVSYKNNVNAGTATVTVTGKGSYKGTLSKTFKIDPVKLKSVTVNNPSLPYRGRAIEAALKVTAEVNGTTRTFTTGKDKGKVFTVSYKNNVNAGTASVTVKGIGNYTGTLTTTFTIKPVKLTSVKVKNDSLPYTGRAHKPILIVKAKVDGKTVTVAQSKGYTVTYSNNVEPGTANVTVKGKGNFTGTVKTTFTINRLKLNDKTAVAELSKTTMKYTGKALKPKVTVTSKIDGEKYVLVKGTDYTVTYQDNIKRGTAKVIIKGIGHFTGTITLTFTIK